MILFHLFLDILVTSPGNTDFGETVEEVPNQVKRHEAFEKLVNLQDEKLEALVQTGNKLINQKHFDSDTIADVLEQVQAKRQNVHQLCAQRRLLLSDALLYAEFNRDVSEARSWTADKQKHLEADVKTGEVTDLEDKIKKLQKHQAFQAEVAANEGESKRSEIKTLLRKNHRTSKDIASQLRDLDEAWRQLIREVNSRGKGLEEAQDILEFNNQLDKIEAWIRDKEVDVVVVAPGEFTSSNSRLSDQVILEQAKEMCTQLCQEQRIEYGKDYFETVVRSLEAKYTKYQDADLSQVLKALTDAVTRTFPLPKYTPVTKKEKIQAFVAEHLPRSIYDIIYS